jgi:hypothetical protein
MTEISQHGMYDHFEGYRTPSLDDYRHVITEGIVVPDANVLLNLYRYTDQASSALLSALERLGSQLWVPHQVLHEFWQNRESVLRDPRDTEKTTREMDDAKTKAVARFRTWANRVSLPTEESAAHVGALTAGFDAVIGGIRRFSDSFAPEAARDTSKDQILQRLEPILEGNVGAPLDSDPHEAAVAEGLRRVAERLPPGYRDKKKDDPGAAGDYLIWEQVLIEAERRGCDVLFVTGDVKDDWWREVDGEPRGPRVELVAELQARSGGRLFMLRPAALLSIARDVLAVDVTDESVENTDTVDRLVAERATRYMEQAEELQLSGSRALEGRKALQPLARWIVNLLTEAGIPGPAVSIVTLDPGEDRVVVSTSASVPQGLHEAITSVAGRTGHRVDFVRVGDSAESI